MSERPLISVVIPTYNRGRQTVAAVESVLAQTYSEIEIIIVDDGSTDNSASSLREFVDVRASKEKPIRLVSQSNSGQSAARNRGIEVARGEFIAFLDSDDLWEPQKLEWQMKAFDLFQDHSDVCFTDVFLLNSEGLRTRSFEDHRRLYKDEIGIDYSATASLAESFCGFWLSGMLARAETVRKVGGFNSKLHFAEDRDFEFRLSLVTPFVYVNLPLVQSDRTPSPLGSNCRPWDDLGVQFREQSHMLEEWLKDPDRLPLGVRDTVERALGAIYSHEANWHLEGSRYGEARQAVKAALHYKKSGGTLAKFILIWLTPVLAKTVTPRTRQIGTAGHAS
jgi:glycosyltransferase involved in cell wall biosynthesis